MAYYLNIKTTVKGGKDGQDVFRLVSFTGHEELSRLFQFTLELQSHRLDIQPKEIVGQPVTFSVQDSQNKPRFFHGYVSRFSAGSGERGPRQYQAEVVPWLWFLTRTSDCRIFSNKNVVQILKEVFQDVKVPHPVDPKLKRTYGTWKYCVQYRETDFNFVSRLMEQEGIFYYFVHKEGEHTLVLADAPEHYQDIKTPSIRYEYSFSGEPQGDSITAWTHQYQFVPGQYAQTDYNYLEFPAGPEQQPYKHLWTATPINKANKSREELPPTIDPAVHEIYDYPGEYESPSEDKIYTQLCMEEEEVQFDLATGTSYCVYLTPGARFALTEHPSALENKKYAVLAIDHAAADSVDADTPGQTYTNHFTCLPAQVPFRPARITPKPAIHGVQTAVVVGPPGAEIHTNKYGEIQVQFYWDRRGTRLQGKQEEPIWVRVGQIMAGKNWGAMFIPRVGQEVMVTFLEGDPDRPIVTGVVYNKEQPPPYDLPAEKTKSYIKTNSSPGGEGYNELRFEDKKGGEQIFIHAQRDMDVRVLRNSQERVIANRHLIVGWEKDGQKGGDQNEMVYRDKNLKVHRNQAEHIGGDMQLLVGGIDGGAGNQDIVLKGVKKELVEKDSHVHVKGKRSEKVDVDQSLTVGNNQQEKVGMKHALEAGQEIHLKSGMKVVIEAGMQLTIKGPGGFVDIGPAGVTIQGTLVNINSGGSAGSGSGSSPAEPEDAQEAKPVEPLRADKHKSGQKSTPF